MLLSKEQIFAAQDLQSIVVDVPEWGKDAQVKVRAMSALDRITFEKEQKDLQPSELIVKLVLLTCVKENDERLFNDKDLENLNKKSPKVLLKIFNESIKLNVLNDDKIEEKAENFIKDRS